MKQTRTIAIALALIAAWIAPRTAHAADVAALTAEFTGAAPAQQRTPDQWAADYTTVLVTLLPDMTVNDPSGYAKQAAAQTTWEKISLRAGRPDAEGERAPIVKAMLAKVGPDTGQGGRLWLLKQIEHIGRAEVVPTLVALWNDDKDPQVQERARRALMNTPVPEAGSALRAQLPKETAPARRVAIINALGYRRDAAAVGALSGQLKDADASVALAAASALGRIGGADAAKALGAAKAGAAEPLKAKITDSQLRVAENLAAAGNKAGAAAIYQELYAPGAAPGVRMAALHGLVLAKGAEAAPLVQEILSGQDAEWRVAVVRFAGEAPGAEMTLALVGLLPKLPAEAQTLLISELSQRGDTAARPALLVATKRPDATVRAAALRALGNLGVAMDAPFLAQTAAAGGDDAAAAREALDHLRNPNSQAVDMAMIKALDGGDAKLRAELLRSLAARQSRVAVPAMAQATSDPDPAVRAEAIKGLAAMADEKSVPSLIALVSKAATDQQRTVLEKAIQGVIDPLPDKTAAGDTIVAALPGASAPVRRSLLSLLKFTGGDKGLAAVRAGVKDADAEVQDTVIRTLAAWPASEAAPDLLALAKSAPKPSYQVLALRGYIRLAGEGADLTRADRVKMLQDALALAKEDNEKRQALSALGRVPDETALALAQGFLTNETLREEAALAIVGIAKGVGADESRAALQQVVEASKNDDTKKQATTLLNRKATAARPWTVVGPFPGDGGGFDTAFPPETGLPKPVDAVRAFTVGGKKLNWKLATPQDSGYVDFLGQFDLKENAAAYALIYVKSPNNRDVQMAAGSDDGIKVWLNGKQIHEKNAARPANPGDDKVPTKLKAGWNEVLLKITQGSGDWGFYFDFNDPKGQPMTDLAWASQPGK